MAPLFPDLLSDELNIATGLLIGIAFGYVLEQAGFSSSRRLAGLFYGYDFTVLRVFFTAAITAAAGIILLDSVGLLDVDFVYVNPTFLAPAIVGGAIMGLGFVLGGYCPGTSVCAAAIGKKDAMVFVGGSFLGVLAYGEAYPALAGFVNGGGRGPLKAYESLGVTRGAFALFLFAAALAAFAATTWIERRVNPDAPSRAFNKRLHRAAAGVALVVGLLLFVTPDYETRMRSDVAGSEYRRLHPARPMTADELAFRLLDDDPRLAVFDLRGDEARRALAVPGAIALPPNGVFAKDWSPVLARRGTTRVFVDEDGSRGEEAALLAGRLGYRGDFRYLEGGFVALREQILDYRPAGGPPRDRAEADARRFRSAAQDALTRRIAEARDKPSRAPKVLKTVRGGC